jgi:hypothetical protein
VEQEFQRCIQQHLEYKDDNPINSISFRWYFMLDITGICYTSMISLLCGRYTGSFFTLGHSFGIRSENFWICYFTANKIRSLSHNQQTGHICEFSPLHDCALSLCSGHQRSLIRLLGLGSIPTEIEIDLHVLEQKIGKLLELW